MRKFYRFNLLMLLSMTLCSIVAVAQSVTVDNIVYYVYTQAGYAELTDGKSVTGNVVIPAEVEYEGKKYSVFRIKTDAFRNNTAINSVELPASVNYIGKSAFYYCTGLVSVTGGAETFENVESFAFKNTPWLANFPAEDGLKYWKGWIIGINLPNRFDELHIKEGTVGKMDYSGYLRGKTIYLPKSFSDFYPDDFQVETFVVDKENPTFFSDDFGAVYKKDGETSFYSYVERRMKYFTGQMLHRAPIKSTAETFVVAEGTVCLDEWACYQGRFERIIVPEGCEYVLDNNFRSLSSCKYIELPSTLKYLDMYDPRGDSQMEIVLKAKEVPETETDNNQFYKCGHVTLYVPKESLEKYLANSNYNGKFKEIKAIPDNVTIKGDINGDGKVNAADVTTVYNYIANPEATGLTLDKVDINGDGNVNATDITDLYNIIQME